VISGSRTLDEIRAFRPKANKDSLTGVLSPGPTAMCGRWSADHLRVGTSVSQVAGTRVEVGSIGDLLRGVGCKGAARDLALVAVVALSQSISVSWSKIGHVGFDAGVWYRVVARPVGEKLGQERGCLCVFPQRQPAGENQGQIVHPICGR